MANENLQNALEQAGLTLEAFAQVIRVDPKSVGRWVSGSTVPYPRHREAIARALDLEEHELWPGQVPAPDLDDGSDIAGGGCDVIGSWAYADEETAPDLALFITDSDGPIDVLNSPGGIELTAELTDRLAAQAAAGRPVRLLAGTPTQELTVLIGQEHAEVRIDELWMEFWFIRVGERMLFAINFQDDEAAFPPPLLELTGTTADGLFDRAQGKFEELWQQAADDPQTLLSTRTQLDEMLSHASERVSTPGGQAPRLGSDSSATAASSPSAQPPASSPPAQTGDPPASQPRRWPGRHD